MHWGTPLYMTPIQANAIKINGKQFISENVVNWSQSAMTVTEHFKQQDSLSEAAQLKTAFSLDYSNMCLSSNHALNNLPPFTHFYLLLSLVSGIKLALFMQCVF